VFLCTRSGFIFILDLKQDRYFALDAAKSRGLSAWVEGWPDRGDDANGAGAALETSSAPLLRGLLDKGILSVDRASGKDASPVTVRPAVAQLPGGDLPARDFASQAGPAACLVMTSMVAAVQFRCHPLERMIESVKARKRVRQYESRPFDNERAGQLLRTFIRLRPFLFTSRGECLFESFVLVRFLAYYGLFPQWVFGIRANPFGAHCWVQHDGTVLNDTVEHVRRHTPIMSV